MKSEVIAKLRKEIGDGKVHTSDDALDERRFDYWVVSHLQNWRGEELPRPGVVVRPESTEEVQAIMRVASVSKTPVVPYGLGSGVCGGIRPDPSVILVDLSSMNLVREIDETNLLASFDAGKQGLEAEEAVAALGLTIGHWPQSIAVSTVGGWVSTRAAGQFSTAYGNIEDIVYSIEAVLPNGDLVHLGKAPRAAAGPDLRHILLGAEGIMGIVTGVTLALRRQPEERAYSAFYTPSLAAGFDAQRAIVQSDWLPPVMRQYDASEVTRNFRDLTAETANDRGLLLMVHEGPASRVAAELEAVASIAAEHGLEAAPEELGPHWMNGRNHVPAWRDLFERNLIVDTIEVSASWSQIETIYDDAIASLLEVDSIIIASAHSSHVYRTGINLYFTFLARHEDSADMEATYLDCWRRVMEATARHGGGVAHHHGSGRLRKDYIVHDLGETGVSLLRSIKKAVDPHGLMNPGNLIPDE
ncbi:MAG: FAD-binding oxidoreductase [Myxococcales bacterium]|nr:FAD-binding oxidoreductase [Myxococcales bacterium]HIK85793.1 FAD-binding oxidoreductase [Myxococcales bacterium]